VFSSALETAVGARAALGWALRWAEEIPNSTPPVPSPESKVPSPKSQISKGGGIDDGKNPAKRAAGFGVWPLFEDARFDGPEAAPFVSARDIRRLDGEAAWNALG
jgi:O-succinylbenzoate synthase